MLLILHRFPVVIVLSGDLGLGKLRTRGREQNDTMNEQVKKIMDEIILIN